MNTHIFLAVLVFLVADLASACDDMVAEGLYISSKDPVPQKEINLCVGGSLDCIFQIGKAEAEEIAKKRGHIETPEPLEFRLFWDGGRGLYVWSVSITTSMGKYSSQGEVIEIDALTGEVCSDGYWYRDL